MRPITEKELKEGPVIPELYNTPRICEVHGLPLHLIDHSVPEAMRHAIAHVAYVAQRSMPQFKTGYDGTVDQSEQRLYVLRRASRAVAMILTALSERFWRLAWNEDQIRLLARDALCRSGPQIARVWVAEQERGSGLGGSLVDAVLSHQQIAPLAIGWEFPFTEGGAALVRRCCPSEFLACCDPATIQRLTCRG